MGIATRAERCVRIAFAGSLISIAVVPLVLLSSHSLVCPACARARKVAKLNLLWTTPTGFRT
jgi:hypothetical protein